MELIAEKPTLNVGCGTDSFGDVRVDIERLSSIYGQKTSANVIADAHHLPFRDKAFRYARCFHTLEHLKDPLKAVEELRRVSETVHLKVPTSSLYQMLIEVIALVPVSIYALYTRRIHILMAQIRKILTFKDRWRLHLFRIVLPWGTMNRRFLIPQEYEATLCFPSTIPENIELFVVTKKPTPSNYLKLLEFNLPIKIERAVPLSVARRKSIQQARSKFLLFVDDDIYPEPSAIQLFLNQMKADVGAVEGIPRIRGLGKRFDEAYNRQIPSGAKELMQGERGYTCLVLLRRELILYWNPPPLTSYEDYHLSQYVLKMGYKWVRIPVPALHMKSWRKVAKNAIWGYFGWVQCLKPKFGDRLKKIIMLTLSPFISFYRERDIFLLIYRLWFNFWSIVGILFARSESKSR